MPSTCLYCADALTPSHPARVMKLTELEACEPSCGLRAGLVAISPFVIFHTCLGDERFSVRQSPYQVGQIVVGFALEHIADGEWRVFWNGQSIGESELRTDVATSIVHNQGVIFEPEHEAFFELATERLPDSSPRFEARNPSRNGAVRDFEQINAVNGWCNHGSPCEWCTQLTILKASIPDEERFSQGHVSQCSRFALIAHSLP